MHFYSVLRKHRVTFLMTLIILIGAFTRFYNLEKKMRFIWDEGRDMTAIYTMVADKDLTLFGPYNEIDGRVDFFGVFHYYLMAPALWLSGYEPIGPAILTALLGVVSVGLCFVVLRTWGESKRVSLLITLLYAMSPLVVEYARWPWNPNTTPFFAFLFLWALANVRGKSGLRLVIWSGFAGLLLGLVFQLHYVAAAIGIGLVLVSLQMGLKDRVLSLLASGVGFVIPNLSFVIFDLTHEFFYWNIVVDSLVGGGRQQLLQLHLLDLVAFPLSYLYSIWSQLGFSILAIAVTPFFIWLVGKEIIQFVKKRELSLETIISFSVILVVLSGILLPGLIDTHHALPLLFGFWLILVRNLMRLFPNHFSKIYISLLVVVTVQLAQFLTRPPLWSENVPLIDDLAKHIVLHMQAEPSESFNVAAFTDSDTRGVRYRYFVIKEGFEPAGFDQYPQNQRLYVISPHTESQTKQEKAWEIESFKDQAWLLLGESQGVNVFVVEKELNL